MLTGEITVVTYIDASKAKRANSFLCLFLPSHSGKSKHRRTFFFILLDAEENELHFLTVASKSDVNFPVKCDGKKSHKKELALFALDASSSSDKRALLQS